MFCHPEPRFCGEGPVQLAVSIGAAEELRLLGDSVVRASVGYSMITVDCPVNSNRLRQRIFLQAIMSSFRTM